jgi:2'-hydroxyisoflavone reductase
MRILVLGGTLFLGRYLVERALAGGHEVTLFNRGKTNPGLFPEVEKLVGDRRSDLSALEGRRFDAVFDTSGYLPREVEATAALLQEGLAGYVFVSTFNVYADQTQPDLDEAAPLVDVEPWRERDEGYGPQKLLCEQALEAALPGRVLIARPGVLVGAHDYSDRLAYWVGRIAEGGEVLAPGRPGRPVQCLHADDLAAWLVRSVEAGRTGIYNAAGPAEELSMGGLLGACQAAVGGDATFIWVDEEFLLARGVAPWSEIPFWLPEEVRGTLDIGKALAAGLTCRPVVESAADIRDHLAAASWPSAAIWSGGNPTRVGLDRDKERALLAEWRDQLENAAVSA